MNSNIHPIYGNFEYNLWKPVYFHKTNKNSKKHEFGKHPNYEIMFIDNKESPFIIRHKKTKNYINVCRNRYILANNKINKTYTDIHIAVASAFPHILPKETVDHIDDDPTNNHITNLMWMDRSENSRKGQKKAVKNSNSNGGRRGKFILMRKPDIQDKKNREKSVIIGSFRSIEKTAQFIIENVIQKDNKPQQKTISSKIRRAILRPELTAYGYYYDSFEIKIDSEEWKSHPQCPEYEVSTHGRFRNSHGIISYQKRIRNGAKYSLVGFGTSNKYIHKLVWETWVGEIPDGMDIMHDDNAPLCEDGTYRNWLCDLSIGTRSENVKSFHNHKISNNGKQINEKLSENIPDKSILAPTRKFPKNPLGDLMRNAPQGIQYQQPKNRGSKYVLSRLFSKEGKDISSTGKKKTTDEEKFLEILKIYQEQCLENKQDESYMKVNIEEYKKYIPQDSNTE